MDTSTQTRYKALFDFQARVPNELSFKEGDIITLIDKHPSGMWKGEVSGVVGLFPYNFVQECPDEDGNGTKKQEIKPPKLPKDGWLTKRGHVVKNWKRRWFILKGLDLFYFASKEDYKEKGGLNLKGYSVEESDNECGKPNSLHLFNPTNPSAKELYFYADSKRDYDEWKEVLEYVTGPNFKPY
ncbi:putative PH domain containing protein [Blattamonas nauphoetae]|uniref:PH domain containing protein n=1 Tax=Blattamonas nauphoetae TaxID=2049346 RepID=A0ABQ9YM39_9EUKA|nr:putative PH domain containing protein [Blattamonas nauphoetae]